jgi:hypothetical protein
LTSHRYASLNGYENQECIDPHCVEMASAAMIYFWFGSGKICTFLIRRIYWPISRCSTQS